MQINLNYERWKMLMLMAYLRCWIYYDVYKYIINIIQLIKIYTFTITANIKFKPHFFKSVQITSSMHNVIHHTYKPQIISEFNFESLVKLNKTCACRIIHPDKPLTVTPVLLSNSSTASLSRLSISFSKKSSKSSLKFS